MRRSLVALAWAAVCTACYDTSGYGPVPYVRVSPILDSLFVGEQHPPAVVTYYDSKGFPQPPGPITWSISDTTIARVDATGHLTGRGRGVAVEYATAQGVTGGALVVVSNALDLTLLLDTLYLMPGDTMTVPIVVLAQTPPAPAPSYEAPTNGVYTMNTASGLVTAVAAGGPIPYIVHEDTLADTGAVYVLSLSDTMGGGKVFFSVLGTAISHVGGPARAVNYRRTGGAFAFRFRGTYSPFTANSQQVVQITLPDAVNGTGSFGIDSITPNEATTHIGPLDAICSPPRAWALWSAQTPSIIAYSRHDTRDTLRVTQNVPITNGRAISGRFNYNAQRDDLYSDPLGVLSIRGTFVAPLVTDPTSCP